MTMDSISYSLGLIDAKLGAIIETQKVIAEHGCALGQEHTREIEELKQADSVKVQKGDNGNWISWDNSKKVFKAHGVAALLALALIFMAYRQYANNHQAVMAQTTATVSRDEVAAVVQHQMRQLLSDNIRLLSDNKENKKTVNEIKENQQ